MKDISKQRMIINYTSNTSICLWEIKEWANSVLLICILHVHYTIEIVFAISKSLKIVNWISHDPSFTPDKARRHKSTNQSDLCIGVKINITNNIFNSLTYNTGFCYGL